MLGSEYQDASRSSGVTKRVIWYLLIALMGFVLLEAIIKRPAAHPEGDPGILSYEHSSSFRSPKVGSGDASFDGLVRETSARVAFLVNAALVSYLVFGCIFIPLTWLLLFRQPPSQAGAQASRGSGAD